MSCRARDVVPISQARRRWRSMIRLVVLGRPVLLTRYGSPWVLILRFSPRLSPSAAGLGALPAHRVGRNLSAVARRARSGPVIVGSSGRYILILPAVCQI